MSDQVGNPEDRFSHNKAHIAQNNVNWKAQGVPQSNEAYNTRHQEEEEVTPQIST